MSPDLAESLSAERHRKFVGRVAEGDLFRSALAADEPPFNVLYVFGSGGVGKTTLLREFANICKEADVQASYVDARNLEPSPDSFMGALCSALGLAERDSPFESLASRSKLQVVMVDTYESLAPLGAWMSEVFLPQLPGSLLLVLADPGWQRLIRPLHLRNLSREESQTYLLRREVPPDQHKDILDFTHGHPLAPSLIADVFVQRPGVRFRPAETPDVIQTILEQIVQQVPGPAHRTALESCALVRHTTETLLSHMATMPEVHELFEWLRGLAFIESGALPARRGTRSAGRRSALAQSRVVRRAAPPGPRLLRCPPQTDPRPGAATRPLRLHLPAPGERDDPALPRVAGDRHRSARSHA